VNIAGTLTVAPGAAIGMVGSSPDTAGTYGPTYAIPKAAQAKILNPGPMGGGAGGTLYKASTTDALGGGSLQILASGAVAISGTINANGAAGMFETLGSQFATSGGGAGGIVILVSSTSISNTGTINANGAAGGPDSAADSGGGGGGGIVHFVAPSSSITPGTVNVIGGAAGGASTANGYGLPGGACGGNGGHGTYSGNIASTAGSTGNVFSTYVSDPRTILVP